MNSHNTFDQPNQVKLEFYDGAKLTGAGIDV